MLTITCVIDLFLNLEKFIENRTMFTCFDMTKKLRSLGHVVKHSDIQYIIHKVFEESSFFEVYDRFTHTFATKNGDVTAELFAEVGSNIDSYDPDNIGYIPTKIDDDTFVIPSKTSSNKTSTVFDMNSPKFCYTTTDTKKTQPQTVNSKDINLDKRGRACIPNKLVRSAGFSKGDVVYLSDEYGKLVITKTLDYSNKYISSLKVDKDENIRIPKKRLRQGIRAFSLSTKPFSWSVDNKIYVTQ